MRVVRTMMAIAACAMAVTLAGCSGGASTPPASSGGGSTSTEQTSTLDSVEVREYQGKRLDSVEDFRENSIKGPQTVDIDAYRLKVFGKVDTPLELTYDEVIDRHTYRKVVTLNCVEGWSVDILWEGVKISDLLGQAGYDPDASTVIFRCYDGYSTSLPLSTVVDRDLLLAYRMNGIDLPAERGYPFQVVAEDKYGYKWAKWVTSIEVSDETGFKGYWESRGFDNEADVPGTE